MYETEAMIADLQDLLDRSLAAAGPHLRDIYRPENLVPAAELVELLPRMQVIDLATVTAAGEPRVSPVDGLFFEGRWIFGSSPQSARARHLAARPACSAAHTRGEGLCVVTHGRAEPVDLRDPASARVLAHWRDIYPDFDDWASLDTPCWRLQPSHMFARRPAEER